MRRFVFPVIVGVLLSLVSFPRALQGQAGGAALNKASVPVKLITTRATRLHAQPDPSSDSSPVPAFKFWYVLPPDRTAPSRRVEDLGSLTRDGFYRVASGDSEAEYRGWVPEGDAVEWHHRQAVKFSPRQGRTLAHFYATGDEAKSAFESGQQSAATHREPEASGGELILMPVLEAKSVTIDGQEMELYQTAFMAGHPETAVQPAAGGGGGGLVLDGVEGVVTREVVQRDSTIDVVFVVDTTQSMQPVIEMVRRSIESVTSSLSSNEQLRPRLRFGLVGYRDQIANAQGMEYVAKIFCTLEEGQDHQRFLGRLGQLREASVGSEGYPEDGLAGLDLAMAPEMGWNPLGWKNIVVVGDASWKNPDHPDPSARSNQGGLTLATVLAKAQPGTEVEDLAAAGFIFYAVRVKDSRVPEDHQVGDEQVNILLAGRIGSGGQPILVRGGSQPEDFSSQLAQQINARLQTFEQAVVQGQPSRPSAGAVATTSSGGSTGGGATTSADYPWPVLEILQAAGSGSASGAGGMQFESRYSTEFDADGNRVFVPHLFIRKGQLLSFTSMLDFLQQQLEDAGDPGSRDVATIVKGLMTLSATLNIAEPISPEMPVERFLSVLLGFPIKNPIFQLTIADLAAMSQTDYDDWVKSVKAQKDSLKALTENSHIWKKLHKDSKERDAHAFVAMSDLP